MDQAREAASVDREVIATTVKSVVQNYQLQQRKNPKYGSQLAGGPGTYPVADLFGRCFLRVCLWVDICTAWTRRGELLVRPDRRGMPAPIVPAIGKLPLTIDAKSTTPQGGAHGAGAA